VTRNNLAGKNFFPNYWHLSYRSLAISFPYQCPYNKSMNDNHFSGRLWRERFYVPSFGGDQITGGKND
jgi:hypothetical protein